MKKLRLEVSPLARDTVRKQKILLAYKNLEVNCHHLSPIDFVLFDCDVLSPARSVGDTFRLLESNRVRVEALTDLQVV
jgi:hypothetical protein